VRAFRRLGVVAATSAAVACFAPAAVAVPGGSLYDAVAAVRARGNDRPEAAHIGRMIFRTTWPVQVTKIRVDAAGAHKVAGLVLSGTKFHSGVTPDRFTSEVIDLIAQTFDASTVEEVDVWVILPLSPVAHQIVAGDLAHPSSYTVYATTVRRSERATYGARVRRDEDVYWLPAWRATLTG